MATATGDKTPGNANVLIQTCGDTDEEHGSVSCKTCQSKAKDITESRFKGTHHMITRGITTSASRNAVFNTPELLENILLQLSNRVLLQARKVNKAWNALIMTSPRLQRKLFLLAEPVKTTWVFDTDEVIIEDKTSNKDGQQPANWTIPAKLNDLLFQKQPAWASTGLIERIKACEPLKLKVQPVIKGKSSIYHKMLVSQPPCKEVLIDFFYSYTKSAGKKTLRYSGEDTVLVNVENSTGVTMGDIVEQFRATAGMGILQDLDDDFKIKTGCSRLWMGGVVFPTKEEVAKVEKETAAWVP